MQCLLFKQFVGLFFYGKVFYSKKKILRRRGEIGRREGLKIPFLTEYRFDSDRWHMTYIYTVSQQRADEQLTANLIGKTTCRDDIPDWQEPAHHYQACDKKGVLWECTACHKQITMK